MDAKRCWKASIAVFFFVLIYQFVLHHILLADQYKLYEQLWNAPDVMGSRQWAMWASHLVMSVLFTLIYTKGYEPEKGTVRQGVRYGILMGLILCLPQALESYFVFPYPNNLVVIWAAAGLLEFTVAGAIAGALYRPAMTEAMPQRA